MKLVEIVPKPCYLVYHQYNVYLHGYTAAIFFRASRQDSFPKYHGFRGAVELLSTHQIEPGKNNLTPPKINIEPENDGMMVWISFLFQGCILRFRLNLSGYVPLNPGRLIRILIMAYYNPHITGKDFIPYIP